ncbi:hypothetical protein BZA70DRAFT_277811 [Myxozyma melibiosi]|uniref:Late embryogenesis abundant protein LEA-2 subgroup domain-containing protein n=1 Tax=Myxozyma melibiosi TaxID=54550 RepID=A0ABR1F644_9ASCO
MSKIGLDDLTPQGTVRKPDLSIEIPPPPYANHKSSSATAALLVHTPYSPGYYDEDNEEDYGDGLFENTRRQPRVNSYAVGRALRLFKWPIVISTLVAACLSLSLVASHLVKTSAPAMYAKQSINLNLTSVSIVQMSSNGIHTHVVGEISFNSSRVQDRTTRAVGRIATLIMRKAETKETTMDISHVDESGHPITIGQASVPNIVVDIRDGHTTPIDFISTVKDVAAISDIAKLVEEYLHGELNGAVFRGDVDLPLRSGILPLGTHHVAHDVHLQCMCFYFLLLLF